MRRAFPSCRVAIALSSGGGTRPFWRADGKELFYLHDGRVMAVAVTASAAGLAPGKPEELFSVALSGDIYAPDPTGQRFLIARPAATDRNRPARDPSQSATLISTMGSGLIHEIAIHATTGTRKLRTSYRPNATIGATPAARRAGR